MVYENAGNGQKIQPPEAKFGLGRQLKARPGDGSVFSGCLGCLAALVPPLRPHRHRYFWVLAPNPPLTAAVTAMALPTIVPKATECAADASNQVFPLLCPICGGQMRIIAFITHSADIGHILDHIGADSEPRRIAPARGPPLWDDCGDAPSEGMQIGPDWDLIAQPAPDYEVDQRINW